MISTWLLWVPSERQQFLVYNMVCFVSRGALRSRLNRLEHVRNSFAVWPLLLSLLHHLHASGPWCCLHCSPEERWGNHPDRSGGYSRGCQTAGYLQQSSGSSSSKDIISMGNRCCSVAPDNDWKQVGRSIEWSGGAYKQNNIAVMQCTERRQDHFSKW